MNVARPDLLMLTPEALAALTNVGLVKRAQKELAAGRVPRLDLDDGTIVATFDDGAVTRLLPGRGLADSLCSCGAQRACRHRVAAVLAYQGAQGDSPTPLHASSPGDIDDGALLTLLGAPTFERAQAARRRGVLVEVSPATAEASPTAHLPTATVRFFAQCDAGLARCDCTRRGACEHVALAVWAFREAGPLDGPRVVELASSAQFGPCALELREDQGLGAALGAALDVAGLALLEGTARASSAMATRFAMAIRALGRHGATWPATLLEAIADQHDAYLRRSARHDALAFVDLLVGLAARIRAARAPEAAANGAPPRHVLGIDEAPEATLDQVRLVGLGARVIDDGDRRRVEVCLADPSTGGVVIFSRKFAPTDGDGRMLGRRAGLAGVALAELAVGQVLSTAATRRADRVITFGTGPLQKTSVLRGGPVEALPRALVIDDIRTFLDARREAAHAMPTYLRPLRVAEDLRAVSIHALEHLGWDELGQAVRARCVDPSGHPFIVELPHRLLAPGAQPALVAALRAGGRAVVGPVRVEGGVLIVAPISAQRGPQGPLVALELEPVSDGLAALDRATPSPPSDPIARLIATVRATLAEGAHHGLRNLAEPFAERVCALVRALAEAGLVRVADGFRALERAWQAARATGAEADERAAADAWFDVGLRVLTLEMLQSRL